MPRHPILQNPHHPILSHPCKTPLGEFYILECEGYLVGFFPLFGSQDACFMPNTASNKASNTTQNTLRPQNPPQSQNTPRLQNTHLQSTPHSQDTNTSLRTLAPKATLHAPTSNLSDSNIAPTHTLAHTPTPRANPSTPTPSPTSMPLPDPTPLMCECIAQVQAYFDGRLRAFDLPLRLYGSHFLIKALQAISSTPYAHTTTYKSIAEQIHSPRAYRAIGNACHANPLPLIIPCHRVLASHHLGGYALGKEAKIFLLNLEQTYSQKTNKTL